MENWRIKFTKDMENNAETGIISGCRVYLAGQET